VAFGKAQKTVAQLFAKYDANKDGQLERSEFTQALTDCGLRLETNMMNVLYEQVLDPPTRGGRGTGKVSYGILKFYVESAGSGAQEFDAPSLARSRGETPSDAAPAKTTATSVPSLSNEVVQASKRAARKILIQCHATVVEQVAKLDHLEEGLINRDELRRLLESQKVSGLDKDELAALLKSCDRSAKGYVATSTFIDRLYALAAESEGESVLRRLAKALATSDVSLQQEMARYDTDGTGKLDKNAFKKCLKQLQISLSDAEIAKLLPSLNDLGKGLDGKKVEVGKLDIVTFCQQVNEAGQAKPLPSFVLQGAKGGSTKGRSGQGAAALGAFDAEKKYKKNLEALKSEIEERNREIDGLKKEIKDGHDRFHRMEGEKKHLETRLVDAHSKPPRETRNEANAHSQAHELALL